MEPARREPSWFMKSVPTSGSQYDVKGFLDDDPLKQGALIMGVPVLGTGRQAASVLRRLNRRWPVNEIIIAMPSASGRADA